MSRLSCEVKDGIATLTFNRPRTLNAITAEDYDALAESLRQIDARDDVVATILQANGRWFCAGTDVSASKEDKRDLSTVRGNFLGRVVSFNTDTARALYSHRKLLVAALNGPVMGIASAFLGHFDFIYCVESAWLSVPFSFLGLITEAGSSVSFVNRMGLAKANEVLIFGKKMTSQEMLACGFVNKVFPAQPAESFHKAVRAHVQEQLEGLDIATVISIKNLIQAGLNDKNFKDGVNLRESYAQAERFATGVPQKRFRQIANKEIRHKL